MAAREDGMPTAEVDGLGGATPGGVTLLVLQPTSFCNLDCRYCYVPDRSLKARMQVSTLQRVCLTLAKSRRFSRQKSLEVLWHAGEPLTAGIDFYVEASEAFQRNLPGIRIQQTFQTNATLINEDWCAYFLRTGALVGISLDGPQPIHDRHRKTRPGGGSFDLTMRGLEMLRRHRIQLNVLSVLNVDSLQQPRQMYEFFLSKGIRNVGFNIEETEGENLNSGLNIESPDDLRQLYLSFMQEFLERNFRDGAPIRLREFRAMTQNLIRRRSDPNFRPDEAQHHVGAIVTISRDGDVFSWSPELASGVKGDVLRFSVGNVHNVSSLDELLDGEEASVIQAEIDAGISQCRISCEYFGICGGGIPANKYYENGTFDSTETSRCRLQTQALADLLLKMAAKPQLYRNGAP